jgi:type IV pilus assembly protein PilF
MISMRTSRWAAAWFVAMSVVVGLAGCVTTRSNPNAFPSDNNNAVRPANSDDIVTASDESAGARRARLRMELAAGYFGRGQMTTALDEVKQAIVADPTYAEAYNLRGLIYSNLGDDKLAEESFRRALQLDPRDADSMQNYAYFMCQRKRYPESFAMFDQALAVPRYANSARTLLTKGVCQAFASQLADAEATLLRAAALDPASPAISVNLSEVLFKRGDFERARFYIRKVNAIPGLQGAQTLWLAARIEQHLGNRNGAQELGEQLRRRFPDARETGQFERGQFDE